MEFRGKFFYFNRRDRLEKGVGVVVFVDLVEDVNKVLFDVFNFFY